MLHTIIRFFNLYIDEDAFSLGSIGITLLLLYASIAIYLLDFYKLIKRKSTAENIAIMSIPVVASACGAMMAMIYVHVPAPGHLDAFAEALSHTKLRYTLCLLVLIYAAVWLVTYLSQQKRKREDVRKWILSCIPDYCFAVMILLGTAIPWFLRMDVFLWLHVYSLYLLGCKVALLVIGNIARLYSMKIKVFRWKKWKSPHAFLAKYFFLYQNAIVRNVFLFLFGILTFLTVALNVSGWSSQTISIMLFLYLGSLLPLALSFAPARNGLNRFAAWGDAKQLERLFCQEYFVEEHLYHDHNFTVTKHFLVEEQSPATVYYLPNLKSVSGWVIDPSGRHRIISFSDGMQCRITSEEAEKSEQLFRYLQKNEAGAYGCVVCGERKWRNRYHQRNPEV